MWEGEGGAGLRIRSRLEGENAGWRHIMGDIGAIVRWRKAAV